jgi:RNA polymerase sigma factor (sigma-70 family)
MLPTDPEQSITRLIGLARTGDSGAAEGLWRAYFEKLVAVARKKLAVSAPRAADEEDVALSAFASFWAGAGQDRFPQLTDRTALWPLLVAITANKCTDLIRRETRQKRGGGAVTDPSAIEHIIDREPPPGFALQVADQLVHLLAQLNATGDPSLRRVAELRMAGRTQAEIAEELGCVRETVGRKLKLIEVCWAAGADDDS